MKIIYLVRHGELANPKGIFYNHDSVMQPEDIIHLSKAGQTQFHLLAEEMRRLNKIPIKLWCSPETRAKESANILRDELGITHVKVVADLDDVYAPGPYLEGVTMAEFQQSAVNFYDLDRWGKYHHETAEIVTKRILTIINKMVIQLADGQVGALISHGDPIAFTLNYLQTGKILAPAKIRTMMYPSKGSATVLTYSNKNQFVKLEPFGNSSLRSGSNY